VTLRDLTILEEYRTGEQDLVESFYKPCVREAAVYNRAVGYFRSTVFLLIGPDLIEFAKRGGKMRLICSPVLTSEDYEAISGGYQLRANRLSDALMTDLDILFGDKILRSNTEALATLISLGVIDIKIAFRPEGHGIYHEKIGVFKDDSGNVVSFKGSVNESWNGWHDRGNYESFDTYCSWDGVKETLRVKNSEQYFERLWNGELKAIHVVDLPDVVKERIETVAKESIDAIDVAALYQIKDAKPASDQLSSKRKPMPHQVAAIEGWIAQGRRGVFEHATGSGKTFTALIALKEHLEPAGVALILVPDKLLHRQWAVEIKEEVPDVILLKAGDGNNRWKKEGRLKTFSSPSVGLGKRVILATMQTARTSAFIQGIEQGPHLMIIADEVHEIGSPENSKALVLSTGSRLGLSATPTRYGDPVGTTKILNYFGPIVQPPYTLANAIYDKRLVPYEYFPKIIHLSAEESENWAEETEKISKEYARSKKDDNGQAIMSSFLQNLIIQRSRIAKKACAKTPLAVDIIEDNFAADESWLIYCEDQFQLREVMQALKEKSYAPLEFHSNMEGDSEASLSYFRDFGGILCSIKCLDQGVDIPKISHAIILASSQNPRQFIQRRGRVLRTCEGKYKAVIFDAIVAPIDLELEPDQVSLLKSELQRSLQFAKMAMNSSAANEIINLAIELGLDPDEAILTDNAGIEELEVVELDD
jgi:superfamily II DNA or RNA helicase